MKNRLLLWTTLLLMHFIVSANTIENNNAYTIIISSYDWGPGVNKVVVQKPATEKPFGIQDFTVLVSRSKENVEMSVSEASGERTVLYTYPSDENGNRLEEGSHITLVLLVSPIDPLSSPIKYYRSNGRGSNQWIDYKLSITHKPSNSVWYKENKRIIPSLDKFDLSGVYQYKDIQLTYGSYAPKGDKKSPLIIWLHGGGEGGTDPSIALIANKAVNYASPEIQNIFNGSYVLAAQTPTFWMQSATGEYTRGDTNDIYNEALINLIKDFVAKNPNIDKDRIYIGGCSNGGYMSLKLILNNPKYFAAGYISALAYQNEYVTDEMVQSIKNVPIWFVHSKDDTTTVPDETVVPLYHRLISAGAPNVHFSLYDHVIDLNGIYGGENYHFPGHWSWVYSHSNDADFDFDGNPVLVKNKPVSIMEWLAAQHN
ncbi:prolyl oligopeptidase family serine peptidase [Maribacter sp. CXY002]|uniref:prolyl oligopeptidase family serine peptidase n=1 Tax=Maribacter luteocoastalis TaxID=3407671 RepID=UPI003B68414E